LLAKRKSGGRPPVPAAQFSYTNHNDDNQEASSELTVVLDESHQLRRFLVHGLRILDESCETERKVLKLPSPSTWGCVESDSENQTETLTVVEFAWVGRLSQNALIIV
jgi:hypothetical protein